MDEVLDVDHVLEQAREETVAAVRSLFFTLQGAGLGPEDAVSVLTDAVGGLL